MTDSPFFYAGLCVLLWLSQPILLRFGRGRDTRGAAGFPLWADLLFCLCAAAAAGSLLVLYPGNSLLPSGDSSAFLYIGKQILSGKAPYRELFDHKGPVLYAIECLGLRLSPGSYTGMWLLEVLHLALALFFLLRLCALFTDRRASAWPTLLIAFIACGWKVYDGGNYTEEYALPWISMALYVYFRFFKTGRFRGRDVFCLGLGFALVFFLRANMIACWAALTPVVLLRLALEKRWDALWRCVLLFTAGLAAVLLPLLLWLAAERCLPEFFDCYFVFNFSYSEELGSRALVYWQLTRLFLLRLLPGTLALAFSFLRIRRESVLWLSLWVFFCNLLMLEMSGRDYPHYLIPQLPMLAIGLCVSLDVLADWLEKGRAPSHSPLLYAALCLALLAGAVGYHAYSARFCLPESPKVTWLRENTAPTDDVLVLGNDAWVYLESGRTTENRYFYQTPPVWISEALLGDFLCELEEKPSGVIVCFAGGELERQDRLTALVYAQLSPLGYRYEDHGSFGLLTAPTFIPSTERAAG